MNDRTGSSEENTLRRRTGCPDLDPNWPDVTGAPRGPRVCVLYPKCKCGKEDRTMTERSQPTQLPSNGNHERWLAETWRMIEDCAKDNSDGHRVSLSAKGCAALLAERRSIETTVGRALHDEECANCGEGWSKHLTNRLICPDAAIPDGYRFAQAPSAKAGEEQP